MTIFVAGFFISLIGIWVLALLWSLVVPTQANRHGVRWRRPAAKRASAVLFATLAGLITVLIFSDAGVAQ